MSEIGPRETGGLSPQYQTYERQKCFVAYTEQTNWSDDLLSACQEVLSRPEFNLEPDYARKHFNPDVPLRQKALELIANARYGIYDLSYWPDEKGKWQMPRNVFIELGMAIALNRPTLLLRHANNREFELSECLKSVSGNVLEFSGETTLKRGLERQLPQWVNTPPDRDWWNRYCIFGGRTCEYREAHPRAKQWGKRILHCHISDGPDVDRDDFRGVVEEVLGRFTDVSFDYLDALLVAKGYDFLLCTHCQTVRSTPFAIYRIAPQTPAETFIAIGMNIALETQFEYKIPKILLTENVQHVPSLLAGYEVVEARSGEEKKKRLRTFVPTVMHKVRETAWKTRQLPFEEIPIQVRVEPVASSPQDVQKELDLAMVNEVVQIISTKLNVQDLMQTIVSQIGDRLKCTHCTLFSPQEEHGQLLLVPQVTRGVRPEIMTRRFRPGEGLAGWVFQHGESVSIDDARMDPRFSPARVIQDRPRSMLVVPMKAGDQTIGVISADQDEFRWFSESDRRLVDTLAREAGATIQRIVARDVLRSMDSRITSGEKLDDILLWTISSAIKVTNASTGILYLISEDGLSVTHAFYPPGYHHTPPRLERKEGLTRHVIATGEVLSIPDIRQDPRVNPPLFERFRSMIAVPLKTGQMVMGVLYLNDADFHDFTDNEKAFLLELASRAAIAVQSARFDKMVRILVADDEPEILRLREWAALGEGREVMPAQSGEQAIQLIQQYDFDIVVTGLGMETDDAGLRVLKAAKEKDTYTQVIVITSYGTPEVSVEAMRLGAFDYLESNAPGTDVLAMLRGKINLALEFREAKLRKSG